MYGVADSVLKDSHLAEDVVQETLIHLTQEETMKTLKELAESERRKYILVTTKHTALNFYKKRKRENRVTIPDYNEEIVNNIPTEDCADAVISKVEEESFFDIVNAIPEKYSYVLRLKYKYGFSNKQIAKVCGITEAAVRKRLERGRKMLLEKLQRRHFLEEEEIIFRKGGSRK